MKNYPFVYYIRNCLTLSIVISNVQLILTDHISGRIAYQVLN